MYFYVLSSRITPIPDRRILMRLSIHPVSDSIINRRARAEQITCQVISGLIQAKSPFYMDSHSDNLGVPLSSLAIRKDPDAVRLCDAAISLDEGL